MIVTTQTRTIADGRYELRVPLGSGGMATVWRAYDSALGVDRALKLIHGSGENRDALRRRLRAEARAMAKLDHPNVLRIYDIGRDGDMDYVVMDLAEGGSVQDLLDRRTRLTLDDTVRISLQVLGALAAAHAAAIVHRDVKPHNILIGKADIALLADFGIALLAGDDAMRRTRAGVAMGSIAYMPPEQRLDARSVDATADIYSMGATIFAMLTGDNPVDLFRAGVDSPRFAGMPMSLRRLIVGATREKREDRIQTAHDLALQLLEASKPLGFDLRDAEAPQPKGTPIPADRGMTWLDEDVGRPIRELVDQYEREDDGTVPIRDTFDEARRRALADGLGPRTVTETTPIVPIPPEQTRSNQGLTTGIFEPAPKELRPSATRREPLPYWIAIALLLPLVLAAAWMAGMFDPVEVIETPVVVPSESHPSTTVELTHPAPVADPPVVDRSNPPTAVIEKPPETRPDELPATLPEGIGGTWKGSMAGRVATLELRGSPSALVGEVVVKLDGNAVATRVEGSFDAGLGKLSLHDVGDAPDMGTYDAVLVDGAIEGNLTVLDGRTAKFKFTRQP